MTIPDKLLDVLNHEGVVAIATQDEDGPHLVNTWNSYISVTADNHLLLPVGGMNKTEANISRDNRVKITVGSREVEGFHGQGTGFSIEGTAAFLNSGSKFDSMKQKFPWARAVAEVIVTSATQTL